MLERTTTVTLLEKVLDLTSFNLFVRDTREVKHIELPFSAPPLIPLHKPVKSVKMEQVAKEYKVTYKTFYNDRLKKTLFHTRLMYPLYVQVIFGRVPIVFKSYYFDLFSKPKYGIRVAGQLYAPNVEEIIQKEETLIDFVVDKNLKEFSLDIFKKEYAFYSRDLLDLMEKGFLEYLFTFLHDEGLPYMADAIKRGSPDIQLYELVQDMRRALNPALYKRLVDHSFFFAPPYLPLYAFTLKPMRTPLVSFSVMEWQQPDARQRFTEFFERNYPQQDVSKIIKYIDKIVIQD